MTRSDHDQPHGARAQKARVPHLLLSDSEHRRACRHDELALELGWRWTPQLARGTTDARRKERLFTGAAPFYGTWTHHNQRGKEHACDNFVCCASSPETVSTGAQAPHKICGAGLALEAAASTSHYGRASKETSLPPVRRPSMGHDLTTTSATRRARAETFRAEPPPQRQQAQARLCRHATHATLAWRWGLQLARRTTLVRRSREASGRHGSLRKWRVPTTTSSAARPECGTFSPETASAGAPVPRDTRRWLGVGRRSWHVAPRARAEGKGALTGTAPFDRARAHHNQRGTARAQQQACVLRLLPGNGERRRA